MGVFFNVHVHFCMLMIENKIQTFEKYIEGKNPKSNDEILI